jgi:hypothetical protein
MEENLYIEGIFKDFEFSIYEKINIFHKIDSGIISIYNKNFIINEKNKMIEYFWDWFPHEISWGELKEINYERYSELMAIKSYFKL